MNYTKGQIVNTYYGMGEIVLVGAETTQDYDYLISIPGCRACYYNRMGDTPVEEKEATCRYFMEKELKPCYYELY